MQQTPDLPSITRPHCRTGTLIRNHTLNSTSRIMRQPSVQNLKKSPTRFIDLQSLNQSDSDDYEIKETKHIQIIEADMHQQILQEESMKKLKVKIKNQLYNFKSSSKRSMKKVDINLQQIDELIVKILGFQENVYINLGYEVKYLKMKTQLQKLFM